MKKLTKSIVAMLALVAMLTQNAYGVYAAATSPQPILVDNEFVEETQDPVIEVTTEESSSEDGNNEEGTPIEYVDGDVDVDSVEPTDDVNYDDEIMLLDEEVVDEEPVDEEPVDENVPEELDIYDNQISGSGLDELEVFINTDELEAGDSFRLIFTGPDSARYDTRLNDNLDTTSHGVYRFLDLDKKGFNIRTMTDDNVKFEFTSEDGRPVIKAISVESDADKILFTKTIEDKNGKPITAIKGEGYKKLSVKVDTEKLAEDAEYKVYIDTDAEVEINGNSADNILGTKALENIELSNLDKEAFILYIVGNEEFEVDSEASIIDVATGEAEFTLESVATKTVYEYEDANVYVRATLQKADAIPDDAYFCVELVKDSEAEEYIDLMNKEAGEEDKYTDDNTLVYDISFYTDETKSEVIEPEEGSVTVSIEFKKKQISEELGAEDDEEIEITHFEEHGNDVDVVVLEDASIDATSNEVEFVVDSFSKFAITYNGKGGELDVKNPGSETTKGLLGDNIWLYGVVANEWTQTEAETSFAVKKINASAQTGTNSDKAVGSNHQYCMVADVNGELHIKGFDADLVTTTAAKSKILHTDGNSHLTVYEKSKSEIETDIDNMLAKAQATANRIVGLDSVEDYSKAPKSDGDNGHLYIDITKASSGTYYIDVDKWPSLKKKFAETGQVHIKKNKDQKIVFYSKDSNVAFRKFDVANGSDHYEDSNTIANHSTYDNPVIEDIIFVVPGKSNVTLDGVAGIFIMPQATVTLGNTSGGWLACDNFTNGAGEWHFTNGHLPSPEDANAEFEFLITKELVGGEWPANGFTFELKRHMPVDGVDDSSNNDAKNSATKSPLPDKLRITIPGNGSETQSASFGKIKFVASDIWVENSGDVAANGIISKDSNWYWKNQSTHNTYDKVMDQMYMYEIREVSNPKDPSIVYDTKPWYLKINVHVAKEKDRVNNRERFVIWYDAKTDRSVLPVNKREDKKLECMNIGDQPIRFVNTCKPSVVLEGEKTINGDGTNVPSGKFEFSLYEYDRSNNFQTNAKQTVKNNGNKFTFNSINLDYDGCTTYCAADGTVLNGTYWNEELREKAAYGYTYFLIKETKCEAPYEVQHKVLARVKIAKKYAKEAGKDVFKGYDTSVTYFRYGKDDPTDINNLNNGGHIMTFDNKYESVGYIRVNALKQMAGADLDKYNGKFYFEISSENDPLFKTGTRRELGHTVLTNHADGTGKNAKYITFDTLQYNQDDVAGSPYIYHIKEIIPEGQQPLPGIVYDTTDYKMVVTLTENWDKTISCAAKVYRNDETTPSYQWDNSAILSNKALGTNNNAAEEQAMEQRPVFNNTYKADGKVVMSATKTFTGAIPAGKKFTFDLKDANGVVLDTKELTSSGVVNFKEISYPTVSAVGDYAYTISERHPAAAVQQADGSWLYQGIKYDGHVYNVTVNVVDNGSGTLQVTKKVDGVTVDAINVGFTNDYSSESIKTSIEGTKTLVGKDLEDGEFTFVIAADNDAAKNTADCVIPNASVTNDAAGKFAFQNIEFKKAGTYTFKITETPGDVENMTYSDDEYEVEIVVKDDNAGKLYIDSKKVNGAANGEIGFTNTYNGEGEVYLVAKKTLNGRTLENEQFTFELLDKDHNSLGDNYVEKNDAKGDITFNAIKYTLSDLSDGNGGYLTTKDFVYYIKEKVETEVGGYTYDETEKKVTVTVVRNADGSLTATPAYEDGKAEFINIYSAKGEAQFGGYKSFVGKKFTDSDSGLFSAVLKAENGAVIDTQSINKDGMSNRGKYLFKKIEYTQPGTYKYTVEETGTVEGITNDTTKFNVEVSVTDNGDGTLLAVVTTDNDARTFVNTYNTPGKATVQAKKTVDFGELKQFEFKLYDEQNNVVDTKKNDASGNIIFKQLDYKRDQLNKDAAGNPVATTFKYQIRETNAGQKIDGFEYSSLVYNVEVTVTPNDDELTTAVVYKDSEGAEVAAADVVFENKYTANGKVVLQAKKKLTGRDMTTGQFSFELRDEKGVLVCPAVPVSAAKAGVDAVVTFPELSFTQADLNNDNSHAIEGGKYAKYYTIREVIPANVPAGYTYDKAVYNVQVTLKDNGKGVIETDWSAVKAGSEPEKHSILTLVWNSIKELFTGESADKNVAFENKYVAEGKVKFSAHKTLTGATLSAGDFSFNISGKKEDGSAVNETLENDVNGTVNFTEITYTKPGTYEYTIKEVVPAKDKQKPGYTYDTIEHKATVSVTDNGSGVLTVSTLLDGKTVTSTEVNKPNSNEKYGLCTPAAVEFTNSYRTTGDSVVIDGSKVVSGREAKAGAGEFTFVLTGPKLPEAGVEASTKSDATFAFAPIEYTFEDLNGKTSETYTYTVSEVEGTDSKIIYSKEVYQVEVTLTDNLNGTMTASKKVVGADAVVFTNTYIADSSLPLSVKKIVKNKVDADNLEFTFELSGTGIDPAEEVTAKAGEVKDFTTQVYKLADFYDETTKSYKDKLEYDYVIKEISQADDEDYDGYDFDDTEYNIHVEVLNDSSKLTVKYSVDDAALVEGAPATFVFTNTYKADGQTEIEGTKTLTGRDLGEGEFKFVLKGYNLPADGITVPNAADGSFKFGGEGTDILKFTQDDIGHTYNYTVEEVIPDGDEKDEHIDYDPATINVAITVQDAGKGELSFKQTVTNGRDGKVAFVNEYTDDASVPFVVAKELTGRHLNNGEFSFTLKQTAGETIKAFASKEKTVVNNGTVVDFGNIEFDQTEVGDYEFEITEDSGNVAGVDYSKNKYTAKVKVSVKNGKLVAEKVEETGSKTFTNDFTASAYIDLSGEKKLSGFESDKIKKGEYTFILKDASGKTIADRTVNGRGEYEFKHNGLKAVKELNYTQNDLVYNAADGTYTTTKTYTVEEFEPTEHDSHITYDKKVYTVTVTLDLDTVTGEMTAVGTTDKGVSADDMNFTNTYEDENTWAPSVEKSVEGKNYENGKYTYKLTEITGVPSEGAQAVVKADGHTETIVNTDVTTNFTAIKFTQNDVGTYYYMVEETATADGTAVDNTVYYVTVDVDVDETTQALTITPSYTKVADGKVSGATGIKFTNEYNAEVEIPLSGLKKLEGRDLADKEFSFAIMDGDKILVNNENEMVATNAASEMGKDGVAEGAFTFPTMKFDQEVFKNAAGTYDKTVELKYTVVEQAIDSKKSPNVTSKNDMYSLTIKLTANVDGIGKEVIIKKLGEKEPVLGIGAKNADLVFTNVYNAEGQWDPEGFKELFGKSLADDDFSFEIREVDGNNKTVKDHAYTVTNKGNSIKFSSDSVISKSGDKFLKYQLSDIDPESGVRNYTYEFREVDEKKNGIKYDEQVYTIAVRVSDKGDGTLNVDVNKDYLLAGLTQKFKDANIEEKLQDSYVFAFFNEYEADGQIDLIGTKVFDGPAELAEGFKFSIKETTEGAPGTVIEVPNENGVVSFKNLAMLTYKFDPSMKIDNTGLHTYEIREVIPEDAKKAAGVKYDESIYTVTIDVTDDENGKLIPEVKSVTRKLNGGVAGESYDFFVGSETNRADYFSFTNEYKARGEVVFRGTKYLKQYEDSKSYITGDELKQYQFKLIDVKTGDTIASANPDENGNYILGLDSNKQVIEALKYTQKDVGTKQYKIVETEGSVDGVVYDKAVYDITVNIADADKGSDRLNISVTYKKTVGTTVGSDVTASLDTPKPSEVKFTSVDEPVYLHAASSFDFTNYKPEYVVLSGKKHWVGGPANATQAELDNREVTINLYASNVGVGGTVINSAKVNAASNYEYKFSTMANGKKLPAYTTTGERIIYRVEEVEVPGYLSEKYEVVPNKVYDFYNTYGELLIKKVDALTGDSLAGAELAIIDASGNEVDRWVSGTSAHVVDVTKVKMGATYTLREIKAPTGYKIAPDQTFEFKKGETTVVEMRDERIVGSVRLRKLDATTRAALEGAEFALYKEDGTRIYAAGAAGSYTYSERSSNGRFVVNASGELEIRELPYGSYYFTEVTAPAGYMLSTERFAFSVLEDGAVVEVVALNTKEVGSVRLRKTNADGTVSLAGAVFELYAKTPSSITSAIASTIYSDVYYRVGTYITDASGMIEVGDLPWDDYYFVEVQAPVGYEINTDVNGDPIAYTFTIGTAGTAFVSYDLGRITNNTTPPTPPTPPTTPPRGGEVRGARRGDDGRRTGGVLSGVLGVRAAPKSGVLGERLGPVTGDAFNIFLWTLLLLASIGSIIAVAIVNAKRKRQAR